MIAHDKIFVAGYLYGTISRRVNILRRDVRLFETFPVNVNASPANLHFIAGQPDNPLDKRFRAVQGIPEDDHVSTSNGLEMIHEFVDENPLLIREQRSHAGAFDFNRLVEEDDDDHRQAERDDQVAGPNAQFTVKAGRGFPLDVSARKLILLMTFARRARTGVGRLLHGNVWIAHLYHAKKPGRQRPVISPAARLIPARAPSNMSDAERYYKVQ